MYNIFITLSLAQFTSFKKWFLRLLLKVEYVYTGPLDTELVESMNDCDPEVCILIVIGWELWLPRVKFFVVIWLARSIHQSPKLFHESLSCPTSFSKINDDIVTAWYAMILSMSEFVRSLHCRRDCGFLYRPARSTTSRVVRRDLQFVHLNWILLLFFLNQGPLMLHTSKQYPSQDATAFHVFGRVMSGTSKNLVMLW